jgi:molybdopterin/thiamine biosynthesis adenylyltransferase
MLPAWELAAVRPFEEDRLEIEDHQAEPQSAYFPPHKNQIFLMDSSWLIPGEIKKGLLKVSISIPVRKISPNEPLQAWVLSAHKNDKIIIEGCSVSKTIDIFARSKGGWQEYVRWSRIDKVPKSMSMDEIKEISQEAYFTIDNEIRKGRSGIHGLCFREEDPSGGFRDGWLFFAYKPEFYKDRGQKKIRGLSWVITSEQAGENDFFQRVPELRPLRDKTVAVIGLGCIGAPSALEFARAGVGEIRLWDGDHVSSGTICRWPEGMSAISEGKVKRLTGYIRENYPFTNIGTNHYPEDCNEDFRIILGNITRDYDQIEGLKKFIEGADLIYDSTAEEGISHLLADLAKKNKIPYVSVSSRPGGWGGSVVRVLPGNEKGCYLCFLRALEVGDINQPTYDPEGDELQPVGCGDLTFRASSFDVQEISLAGVRMAIATLCDGVEGGYPQLKNDVGILHLRSDSELIFPKWEEFDLKKYPDCNNRWCGR